MPAYLNCDEGDEGRNINMRSSKYPLRLDLSLVSKVPCVKAHAVINQFSIYLLRIPSLHYLAEIGLHVQGYLRSNFGHFRDNSRVLFLDKKMSFVTFTYNL